jgi:hypothetical protein
MRNLPKWLFTLAGVFAFLIFAAAALLYGNDWWLSGLATAAFIAWLAGVLAAVYAPVQRRPAVVGGLVVSFLYILLALGPWFSSTVGPWLVTTRAFSHIETKWLAREPQVTYQTVPVTTYPYMGGSSIWTSTSLPGGYTGGMTGFYPGYIASPSVVTVPTGPSTFVTTGHWLSAIVAAAIGALAAGWIARRSRRRAHGENPFAAAPSPAAE